MTSKLVDDVLKAAGGWQKAFNAGDAAGCANCYEEAAVMTVKPFGIFSGKVAIQDFWVKLIADGFTDVAYHDLKWPCKMRIRPSCPAAGR